MFGRTIDKQTAADRMYSYKSRYNAMIESICEEDRLHAEVCRLACQAWQRIITLLGNPDIGVFEEEVNKLVEEINTKWDSYCATGKPGNDIEEMRSELVVAHREMMAIEGEKVDPEIHVFAAIASDVLLNEQQRLMIDVGRINGVIDEIRKELLDEPDDWDAAIEKLKKEKEAAQIVSI